MTDTVLQSFCERCGTRYTFTEPEPKPEGGRTKLGRFGRRSQEPTAEPSVSTTLPSSDRFESTFHFCLDCRQYTCANCWNAEGGACFSCRPPGQTVEAAKAGAAASLATPKVEPTAWPSDDLARAAAVPAPRNPETPVPQGSASSNPWQREGSAASATEAGSETATELDEWGRPRAKEQVEARAEPTAQPDVARPAPDPWRGVVFSADEAATDAETPTKTTPAPDGHDIVASAEPLTPWSPADKPSELAAAPEAEVSAWPEVDHKDEAEPASRSDDEVAPIDAADLARVGAAFVGGAAQREDEPEPAAPDEDAAPGQGPGTQPLERVDAVEPDTAADASTTDASAPADEALTPDEPRTTDELDALVAMLGVQVDAEPEAVEPSPVEPALEMEAQAEPETQAAEPPAAESAPEPAEPPPPPEPAVPEPQPEADVTAVEPTPAPDDGIADGVESEAPQAVSEPLASILDAADTEDEITADMAEPQPEPVESEAPETLVSAPETPAPLPPSPAVEPPPPPAAQDAAPQPEPEPAPPAEPTVPEPQPEADVAAVEPTPAPDDGIADGVESEAPQAVSEPLASGPDAADTEDEVTADVAEPQPEPVESEAPETLVSAPETPAPLPPSPAVEPPPPPAAQDAAPAPEPAEPPPPPEPAVPAAEPEPAEPPPPPEPAVPAASPDVETPARPPGPPPLAPIDAIGVWSIQATPGPFGQPYQAPTTPPAAPLPPPAAAAPAAFIEPAGQPPAPPSAMPPAVQTAAPSAVQPAVSPPQTTAPAPLPPPAATTPMAPSAAQPVAPAPLPPQTPAATPPAPQAAPPIPPAGPPPVAAARPNTRACPSCSLPLSAKARFCRRCGAPQP